MTTQRIAVVSDIHMSDGKDWSWFRKVGGKDYPDYITRQFRSFADDTNITELVLLGDVFDLWLYPIDVVPLEVSQIFGNWPNVFAALSEVVEKKPVYYLNGNHDMFADPAEVTKLCGVTYKTPDEYQSDHSNRLRVEHGHAADMFNARDDSGDTIGNYPLGFFITRIVASGKEPTGWRSELSKILKKHHDRYLTTSNSSEGKDLVIAIIDLLSDIFDVDQHKLIRFSEPSLDKKYTLTDVKDHYHSLLERFAEKYPSHVEDSMLVSVNPYGLDWYAPLVRAEKGVPLAVFGHTHCAEPVPTPVQPPATLVLPRFSGQFSYAAKAA